MERALLTFFPVFPARAGMIRLRQTPKTKRRSIPRESGDDPRIDESVSLNGVYSPRERG